jgi:ERCC4-type nuclease
VQRLHADDLLVPDFVGNVANWPLLFSKSLKIMYVVEGKTVGETLVNNATKKYSAESGGKRLNSLTMVVTTGEPELFQELTSIMRKYYPERPDAVKQMRLDSGDVTWICNGQQIGFCVESKKAPDLVSGISDGRNKTQVHIMMELEPAHNSQLAYLIQGDITKTKYGPNDKAKMGAIMYPVMRNGFRSINVENAKMAALFLSNIHIQMEHAPHDKLVSNNLVFLHGINQTLNKRSLAEQNELSVILSQSVYGVSPEIAESITAVYSDLGELMQAYIDYQGDDVDAMLENIPIVKATASGKTRRVGKVISAAVAKLFHVKRIVANIPKKQEPNKKRKYEIEIIDDDDDD